MLCMHSPMHACADHHVFVICVVSMMIRVCVSTFVSSVYAGDMYCIHHVSASRFIQQDLYHLYVCMILRSTHIYVYACLMYHVNVHISCTCMHVCMYAFQRELYCVRYVHDPRKLLKSLCPRVCYLCVLGSLHCLCSMQERAYETNPLF